MAVWHILRLTFGLKKLRGVIFFAFGMSRDPCDFFLHRFFFLFFFSFPVSNISYTSVKSTCRGIPVCSHTNHLFSPIVSITCLFMFFSILLSLSSFFYYSTLTAILPWVKDTSARAKNIIYLFCFVFVGLFFSFFFFFLIR